MAHLSKTSSDVTSHERNLDQALKNTTSNATSSPTNLPSNDAIKSQPQDISPQNPKTSADGNLQAKADATPDELKASALSNHGTSVADVKASFGASDAKSTDTNVHAEVRGFNGNAEADHDNNGKNTAFAESRGIPNAGEVPVASADAQPGVDEGALWKAKYY